MKVNFDKERQISQSLSSHSLGSVGMSRERIIEILSITEDLRDGEKLEDFWERIADALLKNK